MRSFNTAGICVPQKHYMVDIGEKLEKIKGLIDRESYFTINRARQYGKTTTLNMIQKELFGEYICVKISFEGLGDESFASQELFCPTFVGQIARALQFTSAPKEYIEQWNKCDITDFKLLSRHIADMCKGKKVVLMIDEVDRTSNHQVFLQFISMLRTKFLDRQADMDHTFHSVILSGVYDVKNIKLKMINEGAYAPAPAEGKIYNSPWNIAVDFDVDMSFNPAEISTMLKSYEADHNTCMEIAEMSGEIHSHTNGYPFLVSRICQHIDEKLDKDWTLAGVRRAVNAIIYEKNTLFDDIYKNLENNKELHQLLYNILISGESYTFKIGNPVIDLANIYGIIEGKNGIAAVSNRIFETIIYDYFISKDQTNTETKKIKGVISEAVRNGKLDLELCLRKFAGHYAEVFTEKDAKFLERHGRLLFLSYLRPFINGEGYYHVESETRDQRRMDLVVDFGSEQFIIELKIWRGEEYNKEAYAQLLGYMDIKKSKTGYLLTFDFRKKNKQTKAEWVEIGGKRIFEVIV
ncbi:MAG: AAA-like domain-containing protein [Oscillospiraceae bacterium]|nr:AAA-like domain-containing protein [Oscillospiraceae bacterium]